MISRKVRSAVVLCGMTLVLAGAPAQSHAIFDWLCPWAKKDQTASTTYIPPYSGRPVVAAQPGCVTPVVTGVPPVVAGYQVPACGCAGVSTTCSYVPQTCYRTVYGPTRVTSYTPVRSCDPCSGCPVVTYRPVTTWTQRAMLQPYTTYRIVYTNPCGPTAPCARACGYAATGCGCATGACGYSPTAVGQVGNLPYTGCGCSPGTCGFTGGITAPGCSSCASGMSPPSIPPSTRISPVPMSAAPVPGAVNPGTTAYWPAPSATAPPPSASWPASPATGPAPSATASAPPVTGSVPSVTGPVPSANGQSAYWPVPATAQPVRPMPYDSRTVSPPWPDTAKGPATQPDKPKPSPLAPVLNAPNNDQPSVHPVRQASYSQPTVPPSGATPRVTIRLSPDGWEPVK